MSINYEENDYFYFFTDGITDQFGGPRARKLMKSRLIGFLDSIASMTPLTREIELEIHLRKWQGNLNQTDDMLFLGICPANIKNSLKHKINP